MSKPILSLGFRFPDVYGNINLLHRFVEDISCLVVASEMHPNRILYHLLRNNRNKMEQGICIYFLSGLLIKIFLSPNVYVFKKQDHPLLNKSRSRLVNFVLSRDVNLSSNILLSGMK
jgi:hypothetical protein